MLLTEQEIKKVHDADLYLDFYDIARAIESAVLERLKAQEPVACINHYSRNGEKWQELHYGKDNDCVYTTQLYTHPLPPADVVCDAERYRWLVGEVESVQCRFFDWETIGGDYGERDETLDAAIDAAMKEKA